MLLQVGSVTQCYDVRGAGARVLTGKPVCAVLAGLTAVTFVTCNRQARIRNVPENNEHRRDIRLSFGMKEEIGSV